MGYLYQPKLKSGARSGIWWVKYYVNGRPIRESTGAEKETEARRFLKEREGRAVSGAPILPRVDRIRYDELAKDLRDYYATTGKRDLKEAETRLRHLDRYFTQRRAASITPDVLTLYVQSRQAAGAADATVNRELATLSRMLRLGYRNGKVLRVPPIEKLKEASPRQGFFEPEQYAAVRRHLRPDLQVVAAIEYAFGWRAQSEVLPLELRQLDFEAGTLRLDAGQTKNDDGRVVYLTPELKGMLGAQVARVHGLSKKLGRIVPFLFPHLTGARAGTRIVDFRKAWSTACRRAGVPGMLRHDFRRTAVRNMVNAGVPERVAMKVTGHRTRAVFDRYHIVSPADLQEVARRLAGTFAGTSGVTEVDRRAINSENYSTRP
jgi:integrase